MKIKRRDLVAALKCGVKGKGNVGKGKGTKECLEGAECEARRGKRKAGGRRGAEVMYTTFLKTVFIDRWEHRATSSLPPIIIHEAGAPEEARAARRTTGARSSPFILAAT
ncbi:hypothetical protein E2C01_025712 [Portunus trituberculatus]|uniref:Uncharacterized protein n=1 Tax=Portunus trituberculatus TaxID=210409 RepID=A0A5B7EDZ7_PORTR|nr:hypothetical protein [Portunus trituberculatus]